MGNNKAVKYILLLLVCFCAGLAGAVAFYKLSKKNTEPSLFQYSRLPESGAFASTVGMPQSGSAGAAGNISFVKASEVARPCVVYIKVLSTGRQQSYSPFGWDPFFDFFGNVGPVVSSGSGVIISPDGYIVTNSHVVKDAEKIEVILNNNKRSFTGKVIGIDASADLALIKIESKNLPFITFANSDDLPIGEWVLAVGNPFNLTSTVTAGIVSAKGRNINLVQNQFPIESFIQTDAAINPGNSGGALVNLDGKLVGINTAILSKTGTYAGYGFAIPSNIVWKVISDIKEFGKVQRAFIEANIVDIDEKLLEQISDETINGVYVKSVSPDGSAEKAGLHKGDIILKANDKFIDSRSEFEEQLAYHRPGDKMKVQVKRGKEKVDLSIPLTNAQGSSSPESKTNSASSESLGASFEELTKVEKEKYNTQGGIRVYDIHSGLIQRMNLPDGFIITSLNGKSYSDPEELIHALENAGGRVSIEGINPDGSRGVYSFYF